MALGAALGLVLVARDAFFFVLGVVQGKIHFGFI